MLHSKRHYLRPLILLVVGIAGIIGVTTHISLIQNFLSKASGQPANLSINTTQTMPLKPSWVYLAQGGEEATYSFAPIRSRLQALAPRYIRIDHIYDFYDLVSVNGNGHLSYDWSKLDTVIHEIRSTGATPFLSLSYMPPALADGDITGEPVDYYQWRQLVTATIEHVSGRSGLNIPHVYYEVWNEPDLFGGWKTYGEKNYLNLYHYAALGAQSAKNTQPFKIGGPATTALYPNWITQLLDHVSENNLRLDFYSWHRYGTETNLYGTDALLLKKFLNRYPRYQDIETVVSEWGINSENSSAYDGTMGAAHALASLFHMDSQVDKAFIFEIQDGKDPSGQVYWGRWGLLTHQSTGSIPKPRYNALAVLSRLRGDRLAVEGQGSWVKAIATKSEETYQIVIVNYDPKNTHAETVPLTLSGLTPGLYGLKQEYLGRNATEEIVATDGTDLKTSISLPPNHIVYVEISPR